MATWSDSACHRLANGDMPHAKTQFPLAVEGSNTDPTRFMFIVTGKTTELAGHASD